MTINPEFRKRIADLTGSDLRFLAHLGEIFTDTKIELTSEQLANRLRTMGIALTVSGDSRLKGNASISLGDNDAPMDRLHKLLKSPQYLEQLCCIVELLHAAISGKDDEVEGIVQRLRAALPKDLDLLPTDVGKKAPDSTDADKQNKDAEQERKELFEFYKKRLLKINDALDSKLNLDLLVDVSGNLGFQASDSGGKLFRRIRRHWLAIEKALVKAAKYSRQYLRVGTTNAFSQDVLPLILFGDKSGKKGLADEMPHLDFKIEEVEPWALPYLVARREVDVAFGPYLNLTSNAVFADKIQRTDFKTEWPIGLLFDSDDSKLTKFKESMNAFARSYYKNNAANSRAALQKEYNMLLKCLGDYRIFIPMRLVMKKLESHFISKLKLGKGCIAKVDQGALRKQLVIKGRGIAISYDDGTLPGNIGFIDLSWMLGRVELAMHYLAIPEGKTLNPAIVKLAEILGIEFRRRTPRKQNDK